MESLKTAGITQHMLSCIALPALLCFSLFYVHGSVSVSSVTELQPDTHEAEAEEGADFRCAESPAERNKATRL